MISRALLVFVIASAVWGQEETRPKVGLVLGGGSALGLSHAGVIQWLEEHRIPVDAVTGTSMGALVGGAYVTGMDAGELRAFIRGISWEDTLSAGPSFRAASYRRKEDLREFPNRLTLGLNRGIRLPAGLSPGHGVGLVLSRFSSQYDDLESFEELPIPFRCVATSLLDGQEVVFRRGRLFDALRSSMAIPGLFTPWRVDGRVLVDGGALNNLPVDVAQDMGVGVTIAVVLETPPASEESVASLLGVAGRSISVMIANNEKRSMTLADVLIAPDVKGFRSTDYDRAEELHARGYAAAEAQAARLLPHALSPEKWARHLEERRARRRMEPPAPKSVTVSGAEGRRTAALARAVEPALAEPFQTETLEARLTALTGLGRYQAADYRFLRRGASEVLAVDVREARYASPVLVTLLQIDATTSEGARLGLGSRLTFYDLGGPGAELRADLLGGAGTNAIAGEYFWRVRGGRFFLAAGAGLDRSLIPFYRGGMRLAELNFDRNSYGGDAGVLLGRTAELRAGFVRDQIRSSPAQGTLQLPDRTTNLNSLRVQYVYEGQDSALVPTRGVRLAGEFHRVLNGTGGLTGYNWLRGSVSAAHPLARRFSVLISASGGHRPERADPYPLFVLGGTASLSALARNQLFGNNFYITQAGLLRQVAGKGPGGRFFAAVTQESGSAWLDRFGMRTYHNTTAGLMGETFIGLVYGGVSIGDKGERKLFLRLGRLF